MTEDGLIPEDQFYPRLNEYLDGGFALSKITGGETLVFGENGQLLLSWWEYRVLLYNTDDFLRVIDAVGKICDDARPEVDMFGFGIIHSFWQQFEHLRDEMVLATVYAFIAIFCVIILVQGIYYTGYALLAVAMLALLVIGIFGFYGLIGVHLSAVPVVMMVMSIGIGVEFVVHTIFYFVNLQGQPQRIHKTLDAIGAPIINGAISSLFGVLLMAFSKYPLIFEFCFVPMMSIVILGVVYGLLLLPSVLFLVEHYVPRLY